MSKAPLDEVPARVYDFSVAIPLDIWEQWEALHIVEGTNAEDDLALLIQNVVTGVMCEAVGEETEEEEIDPRDWRLQCCTQCATVIQLEEVGGHYDTREGWCCLSCWSVVEKVRAESSP